MSGYPDDRFEETRPDPRLIDQARVVVAAPATLLIVTGAITLILTILGFIQLPSLPQQLDQGIADIDADPNMPAEQKDMWKDIFTRFKEITEGPTLAISYGINLVCAVLILVGGIRLMQLSGPVLPIISSILAMIPCTIGCCCLLGLPAGIWALVVINRPDVRTAMMAHRSAPLANPDDEYLREP
jgi:hypothetical protein